jgi:hypothetical protein
MKGIKFQKERAPARIRAWLPVLALPLALALGGCGDDGEDDDDIAPPPTATRTATPVPTATPNAVAACQKLDECGQCFTTDRGTCLEAGVCAARLTQEETDCITGTAGCDATELGDCLDVGCGGRDSTGPCETGGAR